MDERLLRLLQSPISSPVFLQVKGLPLKLIPVSPVVKLEPISPQVKLVPVSPQVRLVPVTPQIGLVPVSPQVKLIPVSPQVKLSPVTPPFQVPVKLQPIQPITTTQPIEVKIPSPKQEGPEDLTKIQSPTTPIQPGTPVEDFIQTVIFEQDADIAEEKEYQGYTRYLLNAENKFDIFARIHPEFACEKVIIIVGYIGNRNGFYGQEGTVFYGNGTGAGIKVRPTDMDLQLCVVNAESVGRSVAIDLSYSGHPNMNWVDTVNKIIDRYDPQAPGWSVDQRNIDRGLTEFFEVTLPQYRYIGNELEDFMCIQGIRDIERIHKGDYFCQDYSLLYAERRIRGMNNKEAAFDLVANADNILLELAELLRQLTYKKRLELGKIVPPEYRLL